MSKCIIIILHILISLPTMSLAVQTNINEVTNLFDQHIDDKQALLQNLEQQNSNAIDQIRSGEHHEAIEGIGDAQSKSEELNAINESDLEVMGRQKRASEEYQFYDENELEPDYTKPSNLAHKLDIDDIVSSTDDTMSKIGADFMSKLKSEGFDCKTVKGTIQKDPTYYIEIKRENQKNTEYEQVLCEEPRNSYNCNNSLIVRCSKLGIRWGAWQNRTMVRTFDALPNHWFDFVRTANRSDRFTINNAYHYEIEAYIANIIGAKAEQISASNQNVVLHQSPHLSDLNRNVDLSNCSRWHALSAYGMWNWFNKALITLHYKYREGYAVCDKWSEDWSETCILK